MSYTIGRSYGTGRNYKVPNYNVNTQNMRAPESSVNQPTGSTETTTPTNPQTTRPPTTGANRNSTTNMPGSGTTTPSGTTTRPGSNITPRSGTTPTPTAPTQTTPSTSMPATPAPSRGTPGVTPPPMMPGTGATPTRPGSTTTPMMPGTGTTPTRPGSTTTPMMPGTTTPPMMPGTGTPGVTPGLGTGTAPSAPGVTPGAGTGTVPSRPGSTMTPMAPGSGSPTTPGSAPGVQGPTSNTSSQEMPPLFYETYLQGTPMGSDNMNLNFPYYMNPNMTNMAPNMQPGMSPNMQPGMSPGMQPIGNPMYNFPSVPYESNEMPFMNYPAYQGIPNMYLPNANPYSEPMGFPLFPLYGYDNSADLDRDVEYMKQLYPSTAKAIQSEIENECDQMEYDGSVMFDEYPDKIQLERIVDRIYDRIKGMDEEQQVEIKNIYFFPPKRRHNHLHDIITIIFLNEIFNRRRRHRGRKRWF